MTDHKEEQELELEALTSIYPDEFACKFSHAIPRVLEFCRVIVFNCTHVVCSFLFL